MSCSSWLLRIVFFLFGATATTDLYTLSLHDALPISGRWAARDRGRRHSLKWKPKKGWKVPGQVVLPKPTSAISRVRALYPYTLRDANSPVHRNHDSVQVGACPRRQIDRDSSNVVGRTIRRSGQVCFNCFWNFSSIQIVIWLSNGSGATALTVMFFPASLAAKSPRCELKSQKVPTVPGKSNRRISLFPVP